MKQRVQLLLFVTVLALANLPLARPAFPQPGLAPGAPILAVSQHGINIVATVHAADPRQTALDFDLVDRFDVSEGAPITAGDVNGDGSDELLFSDPLTPRVRILDVVANPGAVTSEEAARLFSLLIGGVFLPPGLALIGYVIFLSVYAKTRRRLDAGLATLYRAVPPPPAWAWPTAPPSAPANPAPAAPPPVTPGNCPTCGATVLAGATFCMNCGARVRA